MKLFVHGFWTGFLEKTNPTNVSFFLQLFSNVFHTTIELGNFDESDILLETIFDYKTYLYDKKWKYTFLFSGESRLVRWFKDYHCVLYGEKNHSNIINVPLFIPMLFCNQGLQSLLEIKKKHNVPRKNICAVISNNGGLERNYFLEQLEKKTVIDYAGSYKNNVPKIESMYNTQEFIDKVAEYKFIVSMENSRGETYITEKILHGFHAGVIPIYWGSKQVTDYFNEERFIHIKDMDNIEELNKKIDEILDLLNNEEKYLKIINKPIYKNNYLERTIENIVKDIQNLLFLKPLFINKIYTISCPEFEPQRFNRLKEMFIKMGIHESMIEFICPTYKHTITDEIMNTYVKENLVKKLRPNGMKRAEISLFLNYKALLETIYRNYSSGTFLIFESDVMVIDDNLGDFNEFLLEMNYKKEGWDLIHIGKDCSETNYFGKPFIDGILPYRDKPILNLPETFIEDITCPNDKYRLIRKFHTRCTDSFLWNYTGIVKFLDYMNKNPFYDAPFDYYMTNFFENHLDFKQYWSMSTFFIQRTNYGLEESTIQRDWN